MRTHVATHAWRIGVVAQSHAVVENVFDCAISVGIDAQRVAKKRHDRDNPQWREIDENE